MLISEFIKIFEEIKDKSGEDIQVLDKKYTSGYRDINFQETFLFVKSKDDGKSEKIVKIESLVKYDR